MKITKRGVIVEGDPLSSGGYVVSGSGFSMNGINAALLGDPVFCTIAGHGKGEIIEGKENFSMNNKPVALDGHKVSCGCTLIAKTSGEGFFLTSRTQNELEDDEYEHFYYYEVLYADTNKPVENIYYKLDGMPVQKMIDGKTVKSTKKIKKFRYWIK